MKPRESLAITADAVLDRGRGGFVAPLALMVLALFAILGVTMIFTGTSDYSQSAQTLYGLQADLICQAAVEEAQVLIHEGLNASLEEGTPDSVKQVRKQLFDAIKTAIGTSTTSPPTGVVGDPFDLKAGSGIGKIEKSIEIATSLKGQIDIARVKLHDFRLFPYSEDGGYHDPARYYKNPALDGTADDGSGTEEQLEKFRLHDFIGYATIEVKATCRQQSRKLAVTRDVKIINVSPIAREFVLYQTLPLDHDQESFGTSVEDIERYAKRDLNNVDMTASGNDPAEKKTGPIRIFGRGWGRIFMRGSYVLDAEGFEDGTGAERPQQEKSPPSDREKVDPPRLVSNFFVDTPTSALNTDFGEAASGNFRWYGWGLLPGPRAPSVNPGLLSWMFSDRDYLLFETSATLGQRRPETKGEGFGNFLESLANLGSSVTGNIGGDPGFIAVDDQVWFSAAKRPTLTEFSIIGNPRGWPEGHQYEQADPERLSMFRGQLIKQTMTGDASSPSFDQEESILEPQEGRTEGDRKYETGSYLSPPSTVEAENLDMKITWMLMPESFSLVHVKAWIIDNGLIDDDRIDLAEARRQAEETPAEDTGGSIFGRIWGAITGAVEGVWNQISRLNPSYEVTEFHDGITDPATGFPDGETLRPLALYWDPKREPSGWEIVGGAALAVVGVVGFGAIGIGVRTLAATGIQQGLRLVAKQAVAGLVMVGSSTFDPTSYFAGDFRAQGDLTGSGPKNSFALNDKPWALAATRKYEKFVDMTSVKSATNSQSPVIPLDGVIWIKEFNVEAKPFKYRGRGTLTTRGADTNRPPVILTPIVADGVTNPTQDEKSPFNHLNIYCEADKKKALRTDLTGQAALSGKDLYPLLLLGTDQTDIPINYVQASIYADHGVLVHEQSVQPIKITGNLGVGLINKHLMPPHTSQLSEDAKFLHVAYDEKNYVADKEKKTEPQPAGEFSEGLWHVIAVTPRMAAMSQDFVE